MVESVTRSGLIEKLYELGSQIVALAQHVSQAGELADVVDSHSLAAISAFSFGKDETKWDAAHSAHTIVRATRPPLPDPRLVRRIIRQRQLRARYFDGDLFADPAWDMLLDLTAARVEHTRVSVTSLCIASGVPPTTALRWIGQMIDAGLLERVEDETDRRRAFVMLTDKAADRMARYFAEVSEARY